MVPLPLRLNPARNRCDTMGLCLMIGSSFATRISCPTDDDCRIFTIVATALTLLYLNRNQPIEPPNFCLRILQSVDPAKPCPSIAQRVPEKYVDGSTTSDLITTSHVPFSRLFIPILISHE